VCFQYIKRIFLEYSCVLSAYNKYIGGDAVGYEIYP